jgi:arabinogalactan oligomer/maltooligosaccharide transport system permease protein
LTEWTLIWAVLATFSNYILGMIIALMINKKGIKFKALWRTLFVITVAVPQFVSLLLMNQILQ